MFSESTQDEFGRMEIPWRDLRPVGPSDEDMTVVGFDDH